MLGLPKMINITEIEPEKVCPKCGSAVNWRPDCPGYPTKNGRAAICWPDWECGNASYYKCSDRECGWWYRDPNNRGDQDKMGVKPSWKTDFNLITELFGDEEIQTVPKI